MPSVAVSWRYSCRKHNRRGVDLTGALWKRDLVPTAIKADSMAWEKTMAQCPFFIGNVALTNQRPKVQLESSEGL